MIMEAAAALFDRLVNPDLLIRRLNLCVNHVVLESAIAQQPEQPQQLDLFTDYEAQKKEEEAREEKLGKEHVLQETVLEIKRKYGKNSILKGINFEDGATARVRNAQIGGHKE